ncbi:MAG: hypothetical protein HQL30_05095 [Candidatus Omnitrophica bacterium]|nr:hypothetical protein [Candidatus Omnitrophota bacterium]
MKPRTSEGVRAKRTRKSGAWHLEAAFLLGRNVKKVSNTLGRAAEKADGRAKKTRIIEPAMSPILAEIKGIMDVSGLSDAIREMNEISLKHSRHPVIAGLIAKIGCLPPAEQEDLSRKFVDRLGENPCFYDKSCFLPGQVKLNEEDCRRMSDSFIECAFLALKDMGMIDGEADILRQLTGEVARPINDLIQFYVKPKTFGEKIKRLWRMQGVLIRTVSLIAKANALRPDLSGGPVKADIVYPFGSLSGQPGRTCEPKNGKSIRT